MVRGVDLVIDTVGGPESSRFLTVLKRGGATSDVLRPVRPGRDGTCGHHGLVRSGAFQRPPARLDREPVRRGQAPGRGGQHLPAVRVGQRTQAGRAGPHPRQDRADGDLVIRRATADGGAVCPRWLCPRKRALAHLLWTCGSSCWRPERIRPRRTVSIRLGRAGVRAFPQVAVPWQSGLLRSPWARSRPRRVMGTERTCFHLSRGFESRRHRSRPGREDPENAQMFAGLGIASRTCPADHVTAPCPSRSCGHGAGRSE